MKSSYLKRLLNKIDGLETLSDQFHSSTSIRNLAINTTIDTPESWSTIHFKTYPRLERISLTPAFPKRKQLGTLMRKRRSFRQFTKAPISKEEFSYLLYSSAGLIMFGKNFNESRRPYPSAGARYPLELYPIILNCREFDKGLYHYNVKGNTLELLLKKDLSDWLYKATGGEKWIRNTAVAFIISGVLDRTRIKYGERGYRFVLIEAGQLGQNICLLVTELGLGACPIGGFIDNEVNGLLDIKLQKEFALYIIAVGKI